MSIEQAPVKGVSESTWRRPTPQVSLYEAVQECMRSRAPLPPEGTLLQIRPTWPGPSKEPPTGEEATEVEDCSFPWNARERKVLDKMGVIP